MEDISVSKASTLQTALWWTIMKIATVTIYLMLRNNLSPNCRMLYKISGSGIWKGLSQAPLAYDFSCLQSYFCWLFFSHPKSWLGLVDLLSSDSFHGWQVGLSLFPNGPWGCLSVLTVWQVGIYRSKQSRRPWWSCITIYDLTLEFTYTQSLPLWDLNQRRTTWECASR